jgi:hypothetical protein
MAEKIFNLEKFAGGALAESINAEMERVLNNIHDPNTEATKTRKLTLTITLKPDSKRQVVGVNFQAKPTLVPSKPVETSIYVDKDLSTGKITAAEFGNQIAGQESMDMSEIEAAELKKNSASVINLREAK